MQKKCFLQPWKLIMLDRICRTSRGGATRPSCRANDQRRPERAATRSSRATPISATKQDCRATSLGATGLMCRANSRRRPKRPAFLFWWRGKSMVSRHCHRRDKVCLSRHRDWRDRAAVPRQRQGCISLTLARGLVAPPGMARQACS